MNATNISIDIAEVASEVVRVMFEEAIENSATATSLVYDRRNMDFGEGKVVAETAAKMVEELIVQNPLLAEHLRWRHREKPILPVIRQTLLHECLQ